MAVPHIQRLPIPKGRGAPRNDHMMNRLIQSSCHKFCVVILVSDRLRSTLIWKNFGGSMPPDPPIYSYTYTAVQYMHQKKNVLAMCTQMATPIFTQCVPSPLLNLWIRPWFTTAGKALAVQCRSLLLLTVALHFSTLA